MQTIVEVVIGLAFLYFLLSVVASAVSEAIAGATKLRARMLEEGITNLISGSTTPAAPEKEIVRSLYEHQLVNGYGKDGNKPSYLSSRSFRNALLDITTLLGATEDPTDDPLRVDEIRRNVEEKIEAIPSVPLQESLRTIWRSVDRNATEFRAGVERWFDRGMERVTGWYKRRTMVMLFLIGLMVTIALNASTLTAANRLWKDNGFRQGLVAQVEHQQESVSGAEALDQLERLQFPIGWEDSNRPGNATGWAIAIVGWLLTGAAITLGAPFWFDLLCKVSNLRAAGVKPASTLMPTPANEARNR
jgi:hypothetical protein